MVARSACGAGLCWRRDGRFLPRLVLHDCLLQILKTDLQLLSINCSAMAAELVTSKALDEHAELVILRMQFRLLMQRCRQHLLLQVGVIR